MVAATASAVVRTAAARSRSSAAPTMVVTSMVTTTPGAMTPGAMTTPFVGARAFNMKNAPAYSPNLSQNDYLLSLENRGRQIEITI